MGIESRDWFREECRRAQSRRLRGRELAVLLGVAAALTLVVSPTLRDRLGYELPFGLEGVFQRDATPGGLTVRLIPGGPSITVAAPATYPRSERWLPLLADEAACPRGEDASAPLRIQAQVMLCLTNYARARQGLAPVILSPLLTRSAASKADAIVRCGQFVHEACGRPADEVARTLGFRGAFGENLYAADTPLAAPRIALDGWLNSEGHRENLLRPDWRLMGVARVEGVDTERIHDGVVWVQQLGS